jgi:hypothetical protein
MLTETFIDSLIIASRSRFKLSYIPLPTTLPPLLLPPAAGAMPPATVVSSVFSFFLRSGFPGPRSLAILVAVAYITDLASLP